MIELRIDDLKGSQIQALLAEHLQGMRQHSPPESVHALDLGALRSPDITFWTAWDSLELLGCGALKELDAQHGEIKSMRTRSMHLRRGVARSLVLHMLAEARLRKYQRVSLETGSGAPFEPARRLYQSLGFIPCAPFAAYGPDSFSVFMTCTL